MNSKEILKSIINNFDINKFELFFRQKNDKLRFFYEDLNIKIGDNSNDFKECKKIAEGKLDDGNLIIYSFLVGKALKERSGKKLQYDLGKKILKQENSDAGIFIFYDEHGNFRFSLIYTNYLGKKRDFSSFKRFTYFVSQDQTNKTFLSQIGEGDLSTIEKIKEAFSVEKVTKEFYLQYYQLFENLKNNLENNHSFLNEAYRNEIDKDNFAKKLLGQIVFLYFIQKKGWLGVASDKKWGEGDKNFLTNLFKESQNQGKNFFNDYLEPLFYDTLNKPRRDSVDPSYSPYFKLRIPFLNGGLFEPEYDWKNSFINLNNDVFAQILDTFDHYNFTVEEENPDDKEIAVDPEMLGKVFENLLPENLRKGKGTYYTPREIVYYMCRESLIQYLVSNQTFFSEEEIRNYIQAAQELNQNGVEEIKKNWQNKKFLFDQWKELNNLLQNIRVCDPACGSGAFLVGMLNEIVSLRQFVQIILNETEKNEYMLRKETIQNCLYGVDIDPGAIEIAKLRLWLSIIIDYPLESVEPLPNLDYHLMTGNSLIETFEGINFYEESEDQIKGKLPISNERSRKIEELKSKINEYFNLHDEESKKKKREEINTIKDWLIKKPIEELEEKLKTEIEIETSAAQNAWNDKEKREKYLKDVFIKKDLNKRQTLKKFLDEFHNSKKERPFFLWKIEFIEVFQEKGGFDIIIGNPPYIQLQKTYDSKNKYADLYKNENYQTFNRRGDIYCLFYEKGINLLRNSGHLAFITSNKWMRAKYGQKLRSFFLKYNPKILIDLGPAVFESATVDTSILIIQKSANNHQLRAVTIKENKKENIDFNIYLKEKGVILRNLGESAWVIIDDVEQKLKEKIERIGKPLKEWDVKIYYGIKTGFNEAFIINSAKREEILNNCKDENERKRTDTIIKKVLRGRDIRRYYYEWADLYIILPLEGINIDNYPAVKEHLLKYKDQLLTRAGAGVNYKWYELQADPSAHIQEFEKEKLVWQEIVREPSFAYDDQKYYCEATTFIMTGSNLKYLIAILNSNSGAYIFRQFYAGGGLGEEGYRYKKHYLEKLPILYISSENEIIIKQIETFVDKILAFTKDDDYLKNSEKQAKVKDYERQIDQLVYQLYSLTPEEIEIVEQCGNKINNR